MIATIEKLRVIELRYYRIFKNSYPFGRVSIEIKKMNARAGRATCLRNRYTGEVHNFKILITNLYDFTDDELRDIMLHEMLHISLMSNSLFENNGGHGYYFTNEMNEINKKYGFHLSVYCELTLRDTVTKSNDKIYCYALVNKLTKSTSICRIGKKRPTENDAKNDLYKFSHNFSKIELICFTGCNLVTSFPGHRLFSRRLVSSPLNDGIKKEMAKFISERIVLKF